MALQDAYIEALNNCIDRLAAGEDMEAILQDYPSLANELRPMLEAGNLFSRVKIPAAEVSLVQSRLAPKIQAAVQTGTGALGYWVMVLLIIFLAAGAVFALQNQTDPAQTIVESSPEATDQITGGGSMVEAESSPEATIALTPLFTDVSPTAATIEATEEIVGGGSMGNAESTEQIVGGGSMGNPESTEQIVGGGSMGNPESSPEVTSDANATRPALITIEGPVETININVITIFDMEIVIQPGDPVLNVIRFGDVLRIEGEYQGDVFVAIVIVFVDVDVDVQDGVVWRDSGDCNNPPPPWAPAHGWRRRCEGGGGGNGRGSGRGGSS